MSVPALRFPEFEGDWEEKRLGTLVTSVSSGKSSHTENGSIPVYGSTGQIGWDTHPDYNGPAILVARVGANAGKLNQVSGSYGVTDNTLILPVEDEGDQGFIFAQLTNLNLNRYVFGSGQPLITGSMLKRLKGHYPSLPEQKKIAAFLGVVDDKLAALRARRAGLETYKRGLMQKLFSRTLRFNKPDGSAFPDWEEKRLGEVGQFKSGVGFPEIEQGGKSGTPLYKVSDMNLAGNENEMNSANHYVTEDQIKHLSYKPISKQAIIFAKVGAAIFLERKRLAKDFLLDNNMMAFIPNSKLEMQFAVQLLAVTRLSRYAQVGALPSYNASDVGALKVSLPHLDEQQLIADSLQSMDAKIQNVAEQITRMETFKKGLLQQMFV